MAKLNGLAHKRLKDLNKALRRGRFVQIERTSNALAKTRPCGAEDPRTERRIVDACNVGFSVVEAMRPAYVRNMWIAVGNRQIRIERQFAAAKATADRKTARIAEREAERLARLAAASGRGA
jgi:hypothetical protein